MNDYLKCGCTDRCPKVVLMARGVSKFLDENVFLWNSFLFWSFVFLGGLAVGSSINLPWELPLGGTVSGFVAVLVFITSIYHNAQIRKHNKLQVKPYIHIFRRSSVKDRSISYGLRNSGIGPAIVVDYKMLFCGTDIEGVSNFKSCIKKLISDVCVPGGFDVDSFGVSVSINNYERNDAIRKECEKNLVVIKFHGAGGKNVDFARLIPYVKKHLFEYVGFVLGYSDVYGQQFLCEWKNAKVKTDVSCGNGVN